MTKQTLGDLFSSQSFPPSIYHSISVVHSTISDPDTHRHTPFSQSFLQATNDLHSHLVNLTKLRAGTSESHVDDQLIPTISLLQSAVNHLTRELKHHLGSLSTVDPPSNTICTIHSIVETMISTGYTKECVTIYTSIRSSTMSSRIAGLGFDPTGQSKNLHKVKWEILCTRIKSWVDTIPVVIRSIFLNERQLCDKVFLTSGKPLRDDIFSSIIYEKALELFVFSESVSLHVKPSPEKLFSFLDMYSTITTLLDDTELIFEPESNQSMRTIRSHVRSSIENLSKIIRSTILDLESAIKKDHVKPAGVSSSEIHPLSKYVMNYLVFLSDYESCLHEIFADMPIESDPSLFELSNVKYESLVSVHVAWIIFVLLCKLDSKAGSYRDDGALSYLFLTNNLQYIVHKVQNSGLKGILGEEWLNNHMTKARRYMDSHVRSGWAELALTVPAKEEDIEKIREFEMVFDKVMKEREGWVIADVAMREEARLAVQAMIVAVYRGWYLIYGEFFDVKFSPEDLKDRIMRLYDGSGSSSSKFRTVFGRD